MRNNDLIKVICILAIVFLAGCKKEEASDCNDVCPIDEPLDTDRRQLLSYLKWK